MTEREAPKSPIKQAEAIIDSFKDKEVRSLLRKERKGRSAWLKDWDSLPDSDKKRECEAALNFPKPGEEARGGEITRIEAVMEVLRPDLSDNDYRFAITVFDRLLERARKGAEDPHSDLHNEVYRLEKGQWVYDPKNSRTPIVPLMETVLEKCVEVCGWVEMAGDLDEEFLAEARQVIRAISQENKEVISSYDVDKGEERARNTEAREIQKLIDEGNPLLVWSYLLREEISAQMGELPVIEGMPVFELKEENPDLRREDFPPGYKFGGYEVVARPEPKSGAARRVFFAKGEKGEMVAIGVFGHGTIEDEPIGYKRYYAVKGAREDFEVELWVRKALEGNDGLSSLVHPLAGAGKITWGEGEENGLDDFYFTIESYLEEGKDVFTINHALFNPELLTDLSEATKEIFAEQQRTEEAAVQYLLDLFSFYDYFLNTSFSKQGEDMIIVPRDIKNDQVYFKEDEEGRIRPYLRDFNLFKLVPVTKKGLIARELSEDFSVIRQTVLSITRAFGLTEVGKTEKGEFYIGEPAEGISREMKRFVMALQELEGAWIEELGGKFKGEEKREEKGSSGFTYEMILALMEKSGLIEKTAGGYQVRENFTY